MRESWAFENVEFRLGKIEHLPVESGSVDVIISNCVLNLVAQQGGRLRRDVPRAAAGGRFCVSDMVATVRCAKACVKRPLIMSAASPAGSADRVSCKIKAAGFERLRNAMITVYVRVGGRRDEQLAT